MSVAISAETSHSTAENSQLGQNILYEKNKSTCLWLSSHYRVYYAKESGCYSLVCEEPGASGRKKHVSLPFLMQP